MRDERGTERAGDEPFSAEYFEELAAELGANTNRMGGHVIGTDAARDAEIEKLSFALRSAAETLRIHPQSAGELAGNYRSVIERARNLLNK